MLLAVTSLSLTTTEARAQAGQGGGDRAVLIGATSDTPGITVTGPIEDGFEDGVSAFIVEFTPPDPGDEPPEHASVTITIAAEDGWTLDQPDPANMSVTRNTPRGDFAEDVEWQATRIVQGVPEDNASGKIRVVWPWAEFEVELAHKIFGNPEVVRAGEFFEVSATIQLICDITISIKPDDLPEIHKHEEASQWTADWVQNITSVGRTCYYPTKNEVVWWQTNLKAGPQIYDNKAKSGQEEETVEYWYQNAIPEPFSADGEKIEQIMDDRPSTQWKWFAPSPWGPGGFEENCADRAFASDQFRSWMVAARGKNASAVYQWLHRVNWSTDIRVDLEYHPSENGAPWNEITWDITRDTVSAGNLAEGKGSIEPDVAPWNFNQLSVKVLNEDE